MVRTTVIRRAAVAVLVAGAVLGVAGCTNAEQPAGPSDEPSVSYGNPPATTATPTTETGTGSPSGTGKPSASQPPSSGSSEPTGPTTG